MNVDKYLHKPDDFKISIEQDARKAAWDIYKKYIKPARRNLEEKGFSQNRISDMVTKIYHKHMLTLNLDLANHTDDEKMRFNMAFEAECKKIKETDTLGNRK